MGEDTVTQVGFVELIAEVMGKPVTLRFIDGKRSYEVNKPFEGVIGNLNRRMLQTESAWMREELSRYQSSLPCEVCTGARLLPEALAVKIAGEDISMSTRRSVAARQEQGWWANAGEGSPAELSAVGQLVMLTQRIGKNANEFVTLEGINPQAPIQLGTDLDAALTG